MVFIIKVPSINGNGFTEGCKKCSEELIKELKNISGNEKGKVITGHFEDINEIKFDQNDIEDQQDEIYWQGQKYLKFPNKLAIFLGGDHSISYPLGKSFLELCQERKEVPYLIVFDSSLNLMPRLAVPSNEEWLRALVEEGFPTENILIVGARKFHEQELEYIQEKKIKRVSINELVNDIEGVTDMIMEFSGGRPLYISFDMSLVDPVFAPGSGNEVGGLSSREITYIMSRMSLVKNLRVLDFVELNSDLDKERMTLKLGAKILAEFL